MTAAKRTSTKTTTKSTSGPTTKVETGPELDVTAGTTPAPVAPGDIVGNARIMLAQELQGRRAAGQSVADIATSLGKSESFVRTLLDEQRAATR